MPGSKHTDETRAKLCEARKYRAPMSEDARQKLSVFHTGNTYNVGKHCSEETKRKMSIAHTGLKRSAEHCRNLSIAQKGKKISEAQKLKISLANTGKSPSPEARRKMSEANKGSKSYLWKGGISFHPYCQKFTDEFKERVRKFFGYSCVECGTPQNGNKLDVHHVNFNKMACCDGTIPLFVALCHSCHAKTHSNRPYWEQHFTDIIMEQHNGECYIPRCY